MDKRVTKKRIQESEIGNSKRKFPKNKKRKEVFPITIRNQVIDRQSYLLDIITSSEERERNRLEQEEGRDEGQKGKKERKKNVRGDYEES